MPLTDVNTPKYATVLNGGICQLGSGASTVGATALGIDGTADNAKTCYTPGAYGGMVESLLINTNDTAAVNVFIYLLNGATVVPLGIANVPATSGNSATVPNVDGILAINGLPVNAAGKKYIPIKAGMVLKVAVLAAMTANKILLASTTGLDYVA